MSSIPWRTLALSAGVAAGCAQPPERPYDARITCRPDGAPVLSTVADAIAVVDTDGDGALTDADLRPGEAVILLGQSGTHLATGEAPEPGVTVLTDWYASLFAYPVDEFAKWGIEVTCSCLPMLNAFVNFEDESLPAEALPAGDWTEGSGFGLDVIGLEMHGTDGTGDFTVRVTRSEGDRVSGYLIGSRSTALLRLIPEEAMTGQRISVEAFAFRDIRNEEVE